MSDTYYEDHKEAADWARQMLASDALILDTETSGLDSQAEIVQIAIIDMQGRTILDCLVQPLKPGHATRAEYLAWIASGAWMARLTAEMEAKGIPLSPEWHKLAA